MANYSPNYNLYLPSRNDSDVEVDTSLTTNFTNIDNGLANHDEKLAENETIVAKKADQSDFNVTTSPPIIVSQQFEVGTSNTMITAKEPGRVYIIIRATTSDINVAEGFPDGISDPGTGYTTVSAGNEVLFSSINPIWANSLTSSIVIISKEVRA